MTNLDSIFKSRDITLPTKVHLVKAMVFPVVMYGCESWTVKKVEHRRIDAFELWCWRRLLGVPWTARRSNQSILKEISPGISLYLNFQHTALDYVGANKHSLPLFSRPVLIAGSNYNSCDHQLLTYMSDYYFLPIFTSPFPPPTPCTICGYFQTIYVH